MKLIFNKDNWSGKETTITVNKQKKSFKLNGETFFLKVLNLGMKEKPFKLIKIENENYGTLGASIFWPDDREFTFASDSGEINRMDVNPYVAAAKLLCNII